MHVGIANPRCRGKRSRHSRRIRSPQVLRIWQEVHGEFSSKPPFVFPPITWPRPTNGISIEIAIWSKFAVLWLKYAQLTRNFAYVTTLLLLRVQKSVVIGRIRYDWRRASQNFIDFLWQSRLWFDIQNLNNLWNCVYQSRHKTHTHTHKINHQIVCISSVCLFTTTREHNIHTEVGKFWHHYIWTTNIMHRTSDS